MSVGKPSSNIAVFMYAPTDVSSATDVGWVDMSDWDWFLAVVFMSARTGNLTAATILSNPQSNGGGTDVTQRTLTNPTNINAAGEIFYLEVSASQLSATTAERYVSVNLTSSNAADRYIVTYIAGRGRDAKANAISSFGTFTETAQT